MKTGMLWFDNDPKTKLAEKIAGAARYYQQKYGARPNLCFVHPSMAEPGVESAGGVQVRATRQIRPNHLWIGVQES